MWTSLKEKRFKQTSHTSTDTQYGVFTLFCTNAGISSKCMDLETLPVCGSPLMVPYTWNRPNAVNLSNVVIGTVKSCFWEDILFTLLLMEIIKSINVYIQYM